MNRFHALHRFRFAAALFLAVGLTAYASAQSGSTQSSPGKLDDKGTDTGLAAAETKIHLVWRGPPKGFSSGLVYVDAAGHELSRSRELALEKATQNAVAATAADHKAAERHSSGQE